MGRGADIRNNGTNWGAQGGLLSEAECNELRLLIHGEKSGWRILEIGHYLGLSTTVIAEAPGYDDEFLTIDWHRGDGLVQGSSVATFMENMRANLSTRAVPLVCDSRSIEAPLLFDTVFYDGDHGDEQMRFTRIVHESPMVRLFVFDDRDFPVPVQCCEFLRENGWTDESPGLLRGENDKADPYTMTLGVFRR